MSPSWRAELRVGLCPDRLVVARRPAGPRSRLVDLGIQTTGGDAVSALSELLRKNPAPRIAVVLSNHYLRYAVLPWSATLAEKDWDAYARHSFAATYGTAAQGWEMRLCSGGRGKPRVACALDRSLFESLRAQPGVISIQPYLMAAFNARRKTFGERSTAWFVVEEAGRVTLGLIREGTWACIRTRQARGALEELLERESAAEPDLCCEHAAVCSDREPPATLGRSRVIDLTLGDARDSGLRPYAMLLH